MELLANTAVNADTYEAMITDFFATALHGIIVKDVWFP